VAKNPICLGTGLVALDVILNGSPATLPKLSAGGSCGNVLSILGYLGWDSFPVARLANDQAGVELVNDLQRWHIHTEYLSINGQGITPIIIHRILKNKEGKPVHRFEFKDPDTKSWLPQFKGITKDIAAAIIEEQPVPQVFYFDRMNPGTFELAAYLKKQGCVIFFEPSSARDIKQFEKFLSLADIVKYSSERIADYKERYASIQCFLEIETRGKDGVLYRSKKNSKPDQWKILKGFQIDDVKDAAGAGDWCSSGIISHICSGGQTGLFASSVTQIEKALHFGQAFGALNCLFDGARGLMYHYTPKGLLSAVTRFLEDKNTKGLKLPVIARIDISSDLPFSELYRTV
jgi:sugar/nucleoside kinase (ribokinase family)